MDQPISLNFTQNFPSDNIIIKAHENAGPHRLVTSPSQDVVIQLVPGTQALENTSNSYIGKTTQRSECDSLQTMKEVTPTQYSVENGKRTVLSPLTAAPAADSLKFVLVQTVSSAGVPQFVLLPQDSIVLNQPAPLLAEGTLRSLSQQTNCSDIPTSSIVLNDKGRTEVPLNTITSAALSPIRGEDAGERNEEVEETVEDRWEEEMAGALFDSPLLALSESSCSSDSSLTSTDDGAEASVRVETDTVERPPVQSATSRQETPGVCKHGTGDGMEQQSSRGEKQSTGNERGSGGNGECDEDEGEKNGDGEGGRKTDGDGSGNKGREEKDGDGEKDGERDEEEEDFDDLTQDEDEEEVMSSASEESVLSVPELQVCLNELKLKYKKKS